MYELFRHYGGEAGLCEAFEADSDTLAPLLRREIAAYPTEVLDRDQASRHYIGVLRRLLRMAGDDPQAVHDRQMRAALDALPGA